MRTRSKIGLAISLVAVIAAIAPATASADTAFVCWASFQVAPGGAIEGSSQYLVPTPATATVPWPTYPYTYAAGTTPAAAVLTSSLPATFAANPQWAGVKAGNYTLLCNIRALFPSSALVAGSYVNDNGEAIPSASTSVILVGGVPLPGYHEVWRTS